MVPLSFAGHDFIALPQAALFWPARRALLVADLHFEKASWFARLGQMLPPYDSAATLDAIEAMVALTGAQALWCLGDSFHDSGGASRLSPEARARITALTSALDWTWVTGNHDVGMAGAMDHGLGGRLLAEAEIDGIVLRHEAECADSRPEISGHFHPKFRMSLRGRHVSRRCFVRSPAKLVMPAFGVLAGGLDATHGAIRKAVGERAEALVPVADRLLRFPLYV
ncbi:ligase-associated DNA damage response endonuclease PdeM [soil metagenome]